MTRDRGVAIELCAGMGGMGLGVRSLGFTIARAFDSWDQAVAVYNHNFGDGTAEVCNLLSASGRTRVADVAKKVGDVELLAAGPPCKGFSQLRNGHHDGRNGHNRVLAAIPEYVALLRPRMFLIENVPDLIRHRKGRTIADVIARFKNPKAKLRYDVQLKVYDAAHYGTPQARRRVLLLGVRKGETVMLPEPGPDLTLLYAALRHGGKVPNALHPYLTALRAPSDLTMTTADQALSDLPVLAPGSLEDSAPYVMDPRTAYQKWARDGMTDGAAPTDMRTPRVTAAARARLEFIPRGGCARTIPKEQLNGLSRRYDSAYRRLHPDAPSTALSTKYDCVYHYKQPRSLSVREYARLQGIPDRFRFPQSLAPRRSAYEMIGNSVPPRLVEGVLGAALRESEEKKK